LRDFVRFIGPNASSYILHASGERFGAVRQRRYIPRWHWSAFLLTVPWLFYRKMYAGGLILVSAPVLLDLVVPHGLFFGWTLIVSTVAGLFGHRWYLDHVVRRIRDAREKFPLEQDRTAFLRRAGGVSLAGAAFGAAIEVATVSATLSGLLTGAAGG